MYPHLGHLISTTRTSPFIRSLLHRLQRMSFSNTFSSNTFTSSNPDNEIENRIRFYRKTRQFVKIFFAMHPKFLPLARRLATRPLRLQRGHRASLCIIGIIAWRPCANETPHHNQRSAQEACGSPSGSCRGRPCHLVVLFRVNPLSSRIRHSCHQSVMPVATGK